MKILYPFVVGSIRAYLRLFYGLKVTGQENFVPGGALVAANHVSFYDPPIISVAAPQEMHFLARETLFKNKYFGGFISRLNSHPVSGSGQDRSVFKMVLDLLAEGDKVLIFPEGSRSKDGTLQPLKQGLAMLSLKSGCPIIPAYVKGSYEVWPRDQKRPKFTGGPLECRFGKPIYSAPYQNLDKKEAQLLLTQEVEKSLHLLSARNGKTLPVA